jgi:hypothetical protein
MPRAILNRLLGRARKILPYMPLGLALYGRDYSKREQGYFLQALLRIHGKGTLRRKYGPFRLSSTFPLLLMNSPPY